jgi:hypothetical protein
MPLFALTLPCRLVAADQMPDTLADSTKAKTDDDPSQIFSEILRFIGGIGH